MLLAALWKSHANCRYPLVLRHQPLFQQLSPAQIDALVPFTHEVRGNKGR
jgi:hypothetical protein